MSAMPAFEWFRPSTLESVFELMLDVPGAALIAGGTDLVPRMRSGAAAPTRIVSLNGIAELARLEWTGDGALWIGATARVTDVAELPLVRERCAALAHATTVMATPQVRHMATVVGNLTNGSPCADTAAPLLVLDAEVEIASVTGRRRLPLSGFHLGPRMLALAPGEIVVAIRVPPPGEGAVSAYRRHSSRSQVDMSAAGVACRLSLDGSGVVVDARLAMSAVAPTPRRCPEAEALLVGVRPDPALVRSAAAACAAASRPIDDVRATAAYRRHLVAVLAARVINDCLGVAA